MSKISQYPVVQAAADDLVIVTAPNATPSNATKNVSNRAFVDRRRRRRRRLRRRRRCRRCRRRRRRRR